MRTIVKSILFTCLCAFIACNPTKNDTSDSLGKLLKTNNTFFTEVSRLKAEQDTTRDVDRMFALDDEIKLIKDSAHAQLNTILHNSRIALPFLQTENTDKIKIDSVTIVSVSYNTFAIEALVTALQNSAFEMVYTSLGATDSTGKRLDIAGGIGIDTKLESGTSYTFKGQIININNLSKDATIVFDEYIKKW